MKILLDLNDDLAHRIAQFAQKNNKSFEASLHLLLTTSLPAEFNPARPELMSQQQRDELSRIRHALHIDRMYEAVKRLEVGQEITFNDLLTAEQHKMTLRKKTAWRRALFNFTVGRDDFEAVLIDGGAATIKRLR